MRYGFYLPTRGQTATPEALERLVQRGEALGFSSVMIADHVVFPEVIKSKYPYTVSGVFRGEDHAASPVHERDDPAVSESRHHGEGAGHHRRALARARDGRCRGRLAAGGIRGAGRGRLPAARRGERRVPAHLQGAVDTVARLVRGRVLSLRARALPAAARAEAAPADLGRRAQRG